MTILDVLNLHFGGKTLDLYESTQNPEYLLFKPLEHVPSKPVTLKCKKVVFVPAECNDYEVLQNEYFDLVFEDGRSMMIEFTNLF